MVSYDKSALGWKIDEWLKEEGPFRGRTPGTLETPTLFCSRNGPPY